jgi:hypothetical protein
MNLSKEPSLLEVVNLFCGLRVCFPYLYFGYKLPILVYKYSSLDIIANKFLLKPQIYLTNLYKLKSLESDNFRYTYISITEFSQKDSMPEKYY